VPRKAHVSLFLAAHHRRGICSFLTSTCSVSLNTRPEPAICPTMRDSAASAGEGARPPVSKSEPARKADAAQGATEPDLLEESDVVGRGGGGTSHDVVG
jgi:hypothetical protein